MRLATYTALALILVAPACRAAPTNEAATAISEADAPEALVLKAADGVSVHARYYRAAHPRALILLFHQAESNKGEYALIAPRLAAAGYSALAIDQRSGDGMFPGGNQTVDTLGKSTPYADAKPDLKAALDWAGDKGLPVIAWGSSYSAALVFPLAAENPGKLAAVLAFSPGEHIGAGDPVRAAAAKISVPVFVTSAKEDGEIADAKTIFDAVPATGKARFVPKVGGIHGSSTLIAASNASGAAENWSAVLEFLKTVAP